MTGTKLSTIVLCTLSISFVALAEENIDTINVTTEEHTSAKSISTVKKTRDAIQKEMIRDTRDLVRYTSDVGISDNGRFLKGFSMRGVEGNRVGISIDGVSLPDFEENSLYARYGNFNNSRLSIDPELVQNIDIIRGSNSFESGSGALGGTVNYRTLEAYDLVKPGNHFGALLKGGYSSKNEEWTRTLGVGYVGEKLDVTLLYSRRTGHEMDSNGRGPFYSYSKSQHPDPESHRNHSYLAKIGYQISSNHRVGFSINGQKVDSYVNERSYTTIGSLWREANDKTERINANAYYAYTPESEYLGLLKFDLDYQETDIAAVNYKGSRNWLTNAKELNEIYDRRMKTRYKRFSLHLDSQSLQAWGAEHTLAFKTYIARRDFENINEDTLGLGTSWQDTSRYTIQYPIRTTFYSASLKDDMVWKDIDLASDWRSTIASHIGIRYDYEKLSPQELNAWCNASCTAEGKPKDTKFVNWSGFIGLDAQLTDTWKIGYMLSTGYRTPTASEMYFTFKNAYGSWKSNPGLKPERSLNQTLFVQAKNDIGDFDFSVYQTNYRDFLLEQESIIRTLNPYYDSCAWYGCKEYDEGLSQQMVNIDSARIRGLEVKGNLNLDQLSPLPKGFKLNGSLGYSKGKLSDGRSLLSIQPIKAVIGLDYEQPDGKWGVFSRLSYFGAKKASDAQIIENVGSTWRGYTSHKTTYKYLNKKAYVFDLFGYYRPIEDVTLRVGIYNLFNAKYHTWDALRGLNAHSAMNVVDEQGYGLQRYYAPGRNYSASAEIRF